MKIKSASNQKSAGNRGKAPAAGKVHELKSWPENFALLSAGTRSMDIRQFNRAFRIGDWLRRREFDPRRGRYCGREQLLKIVDVLRGFPGLKKGYCVLSLRGVPGEIYRFNAALAGKK